MNRAFGGFIYLPRLIASELVIGPLLLPSMHSSVNLSVIHSSIHPSIYWRVRDLCCVYLSLSNSRTLLQACRSKFNLNAWTAETLP